MNDSLLPANADARVVYEWTRLQSLDQWWHLFALLACILVLISYVVLWYRKDWVELPRALGVALLLLRISAFIGILLFFLDLQKRTEQKTVRPSRLAVLVDTSLSMSLPENNDSSAATERPRMAAVLESLKNSTWLEQMRRRHDVSVYRFDQSPRAQLVASFSRPKATSTVGEGTQASSEQALWRSTSWVAWVGTVLGGVGLLFWIVGIFTRMTGRSGPRSAAIVLIGTVTMLAALIITATAILRSSPLPIVSLWQKELLQADVATLASPPDSAAEGNSNSHTPSQLSWNDLLTTSGTETRLGDAIKSILEEERGAPLAGIVLITDGQNNSGIDPLATIGEAVLSRAAIFPIGIGTTATPASVRLVDVDAPKRVFPEDRFRITALVQANGLIGKPVTVQLRSSLSNSSATNFTIDEELTINLAEDELLQPVHFDVKPKEVGEWVYDVKLLAPPEDKNLTDNSSDTLVRVVQPKSKVLTIASGPTREYQFVRNLLFRDSTIQSHVFLQSGGPGISQESQKLLEEFPKTLQELSEYDCVISFDADWMKLENTQVELLEEWVSQYSGGLVLIAGPVATNRWSGTEGNGDRRAELLRNLSPVEMTSRGARLFSVDRLDTDTAWPLQLTEDGHRSSVLAVDDAPNRSREAWENFSGVYSYFPTFDAKPGAVVLSTFSNPSVGMQGKQPIYMASHFFGAGRVFFQGSGEIWRMRELSVAYFDSYFMKVIRWAGEGRLLRDSDRGVLLTDKEEALIGEQVSLRAVLKDSQFRPLIQPQVEAKLIDPKQRATSIVMRPLQDPSQPGVYIGQFLGQFTGTYSVQLTLGGLNNQEVLRQQVTVRVPAREIQRPLRNDALLSELAMKTGGKYFIGIDEALREVEIDGADSSGQKSSVAAIVQAIVPVDQTNYLPGAPDRDFQTRLLSSLMALIGGCLSLEWLMRRLSKLA